MSPLILPPEALTEAEAKFIAMTRVTDGIREHDWRSARGEDVREAAARQLASRPYRARHTITPAATKLLRVAWQTELAARLGEQLDDPGLRQATLQTLPVQTYYAVFSAGRAFTHTAGSAKDTHRGIHEAFAAEHHRRAAGAWQVTLTGDPDDIDACELRPAICAPVSFNPMEARDDAAEYVWAALRMARRWRLDRAREQWLGDKRNRTAKGAAYKRLPAGTRQQLVTRDQHTTVMDFLYELRCSTNYRSIDDYAVDIDDDFVRRFHGGLMHLLDLGLLTYEEQIALYAGAGAVRPSSTTDPPCAVGRTVGRRIGPGSTGRPRRRRALTTPCSENG